MADDNPTKLSSAESSDREQVEFPYVYGQAGADFLPRIPSKTPKTPHLDLSLRMDLRHPRLIIAHHPPLLHQTHREDLD